MHFRHYLDAILFATLLQVIPTWARSEADKRFHHLIIVQNMIDMTQGVQEVCNSASPDLKEKIDVAGNAIRSKFPELIRLVEASPLFAEAKEKNQAFGQKLKAGFKSQQDIDRSCTQVLNGLNGHISGDPSQFEAWLIELRNQSSGSNPAVQGTSNVRFPK